MSSPAPLSPKSPSNNLNQKAPQEQITFRFCRECSNMLYPKEDRNSSRLMFACRTCQFSEDAQSSCVFRNNMYNTVGETAGVTQDVGSDPTVRKSRFLCDVGCEEGEGVGEEWWCCTFCGREICDEDREYEIETGEEEEEEEEEEGIETVKTEMIDLAEMSTFEDEDMEMDEAETEDATSNIEQWRLEEVEDNQCCKSPG